MSRASDRAYNHIRSMILSGELQPGSQIREEALAELCGVSRTPVRDSLRRLETEMFVRR
ncbi:MAG: GntR family transcriptional regulator, partial [Sphingorhabdus sp.]